MHQYADIYLLQPQTLHVSAVTVPIFRSSKKCICYLWYRSCHVLVPLRPSTEATVPPSSGTNTMTYTRGSRYIFWNS
jgi:hypothetical protein